MQVFTKDIARQVLSEEIALLEQMAADAKTVAEKKSKLAEKAESDLRELKDAIRAARVAGEKVAKLVDGDTPKEQARYQPTFADIFNNAFIPGGTKW